MASHSDPPPGARVYGSATDVESGPKARAYRPVTAVARHQLRELVGSVRFQACAAILLGFFALNGVVYGWRFQALQDEVNRLAASDAERYDTVQTVAQATGQGFRVLKRPLGTEFICEGGTRWFNDSGWVTAQTARWPGAGKQITTNNWMVHFELIDWTFIVQVVVSFLCVLLAYDSVSGERERGTLRLVLANPVSRASVLAGKLIAYLGAVMAAVAAGSLLSLVLVTTRGQVPLDGHLVTAYLLFLASTGLYAALVLLACIGVSSLLRRSDTSLLALVFAWAVFIIAIPQVAYLVGSSRASGAGPDWRRLWDLERQTGEALAADGLTPRGRDAGAVDGYAVERRYLQRLRRFDARASRLSRQILTAEVDEYRTTRTLAQASPGYALRNVLEGVLGTGVERYVHFLDQVWQYRDTLREFLRSRDAADPASPHLTFLPEYMSAAALDSHQIPRFPEARLSLAASLGRGVAPVVLLALEALVALWFAVWAFNRAEM